MASHDRINLPSNTLLVQFTSIAPALSSMWAAPYMQTQEVCFFGPEALNTQIYVADHELLHFLKLYSFFKLWF